jgi:hypothetical protein
MPVKPTLTRIIGCLLSVIFSMPASGQHCTLSTAYHTELAIDLAGTPTFITASPFRWKGLTQNQLARHTAGDSTFFFLLSQLPMNYPRTSSPEDSLVLYFTDGSRMCLFNKINQQSEKLDLKSLFADIELYFYRYAFPLSTSQLDILAGKELRSLRLYLKGNAQPFMLKKPVQSRSQRRNLRKATRDYQFRVARINRPSQRRLQQMAQCILQEGT